MDRPSKMWNMMAVCLALFLGGCTDSPGDPVEEHQKMDRGGLKANVTGAIDREVDETAIVTYLPPKGSDTVTGFRPGYFLIANLQDERNSGEGIIINFRIPDEARAGHYDLTNPDPLTLGENFDVQVETVEEGKISLFQSNTVGTLQLEQFAPNKQAPETSTIKGHFEFTTEDEEGNQIIARGTFDFPGAGKMVEQHHRSV